MSAKFVQKTATVLNLQPSEKLLPRQVKQLKLCVLQPAGDNQIFNARVHSGKSGYIVIT